MNNDIVCKENTFHKIERLNKICEALVDTPHYKRLGVVGIRTIAEKAESMGVDIFDALNGGFYFIQGKVEMSPSMMNQIIRVNKHSIQKDPRSDDTICILIGKRADNGDTWTESFSIEDAKRAGIYQNQWLKYPKDMCFARALSRLARQLFPDVVHGCYVQGEIMVESQPVAANEVDVKPKTVETLEAITEEQFVVLDEYLTDNLKLTDNIKKYLKDKYNITEIRDMPVKMYKATLERAKEQFEENINALTEEGEVIAND